MSTEFTRVDDELDRIQKLPFSSNEKNSASLKHLEASFSSRLEQTTTIVSIVATGQADIYTQLNTIHSNIATMNESNSLLSDALNNKMETLTEHVASLTSIISEKFGGLTHANPQVQRTHITHTHNKINDIGLPPPSDLRNSSTHTSTQMDTSGGVSG